MGSFLSIEPIFSKKFILDRREIKRMKKKTLSLLALAMSVMTIASCAGDDVGELQFFENQEIDIGEVSTVESGKLASYSEQNPLRIALILEH